jgi:hypothetical protein
MDSLSNRPVAVQFKADSMWRSASSRKPAFFSRLRDLPCAGFRGQGDPSSRGKRLRRDDAAFAHAEFRLTHYPNR